MEDGKNSIWENIKPEQNTTHTEINEIVKTIRTKKETTLKQINNEKSNEENQLYNKNTLTIKLKDYQEIFGLITPFIIALPLLVLFPPCFMWCSNDPSPPTFGIIICCNFLVINFGFAISAPRFSKAVLFGFLPVTSLAFYVWETYLL
tara:strand:- start:813 stop:1256 length:444 start_codon:yes stop_codon:yes gene_type:complete